MSAITYFPNSYESLIIGRWLNGIARGVGFVVGPLYVAEITSRKTLGLYQSPLGWIVQLSAAIGNLIGHPSLLGNASTWPIAIAIPGLLSFLYLCCIPWIPHTLVHVLNLESGDHPSTENPSFLLLKKLRHTKGQALMDEYKSIKAEIAADARVEKASLRELITIGNYRRQLFAVCVAQLSLQFTGIQAVMQYTNTIFEQAGVPPESSTYFTAGECWFKTPLDVNCFVVLLYLLQEFKV